MKRDQVMSEMEQIRKKHGGVLHARDVVAFARNPRTALHSKFEWDDTEAARRYRLEQARQVIRLHVTVISEKAGATRAFVSLSSDRHVGGGYRAIVDVLGDTQQAERLIGDALAEMEQVKRRYQKLKALKPIWDAMEKVSSQIEQGTKRAA